MADEKPDAKDAVEYAQIINMDILFPGRVNWIDVSPDMLKEAADSYDPEFLRAPIVLDHVMQGPAHGHVLSLKYFEGETAEDNIRLQAQVGLFDAAVSMIESGEWNERSVFMDSYYPMPGIWYLRHLSLLGAGNPAVPGMPLVVLPSMEEADDVEASQGSNIYKRLIASALMAVWDKGENYIRYRIRPLTSFKDGTFRTVTFSRKEGIKAVQGKLKKKYVPKGRNADSMVNQSILFQIDKWDLTKAKKWVKNKQAKLSADFEEDESLLPDWCASLIAADYQGIELPAEYQIASVEVVPGGCDIGTKGSTESAGVDSAVQNTSKTAKADGGKSVMPNEEKEGTLAVEEKTPVAEEKTTVDPSVDAELRILHETENVDHLRAQNRELLEKKRELEEKARVAEKKLRDRLVSEHSATRQTIIENLVDELLADGYITPGQKNHGLAAALNHIPDGAVVEIDDVEINAIDAVLNCLKMGGRLKLKGEIAKEEKAIPGHVSSRVEKLAGAKGKVVGLDIMSRIDELMAENPELGYVAAYEQATREAGGAE